jgi:hypothetical protein
MSTVFVSPNWRMPRNANQSKSSNYSLDFDGTNDYIDCGSLSLNNSAFSIQAYIKSSNTTDFQMIVGKTIGGSNPSNEQIQFRTETNENIKVILFGSTTSLTLESSGDNVLDGYWHSIVVTWSTSVGAKIYIDGTLRGTDTTNIGTLNSSTEDFLIGARNTASPTKFFNGQIDGVAIFDYALSASQITTLYGDSTNGSGNPMALPNPPKAYYPLGTSAWNGNFLAENNAIGDYVFDNIVSSRILTPISVSNLTNVTQSVWFKTSTNAQLNKYIFFVGQYGTFVLQLNGTDTLRAGVTVNPLTQTYPSLTFNYADGKWHQYIMNYDGSHIKLYVDGILRIKTARTGTLRDEPTYFTAIGNVQSTSSNAGAIGEYSNFVAYEHTLTDGDVAIDSAATGEIATLYNYGSPIRTLANIPQNSNLKAWYKLDASEIYNSSSTEWEISDATATYNSSSYVIGVSGQNTQYIESSSYDGLTGASAGSWSFWYNTQDLGVTNGKNGGWFNGGQAQWIQPYGTPHTGYTNTGEFNILTSDGRFRTSLAASYGRRIYIDAPAGGQLNKWAHIVCTYDGSNLRVYVNGEQVGTGTGVTEFAATGTISTGSLRFGGEYTGVTVVDSKFSNGSVWSKALTLAEVGEIYNNGKPKSLSSHSAVSNLVSWWTLENFTTGLLDSVGSRNVALVGSNSDVSPGSVSTLNGDSSGMSQANLVQSDLQTVAPYSKYAIKLDGVDDYILPGFLNSFITNDVTVSIWVNYTTLPSGFDGSFIGSQSYTSGLGMVARSGQIRFFIENYTSNYVENTVSLSTNRWYHFCGTWNGSTVELFVDGVSQGTDAYSGSITTSNQLEIGRVFNNSYNIDGKLSNCAIWNTGLTPVEVREIYNEGLPSNLNTFSGTAPVSWWQLGENSSYMSGWTFADEMPAGNNGIGYGLAETSLTNGVGTTANGTSTGMGVGALVSDAPYSTGNAMSVNMAATAKGTNVP